MDILHFILKFNSQFDLTFNNKNYKSTSFTVHSSKPLEHWKQWNITHTCLFQNEIYCIVKILHFNHNINLFFLYFDTISSFLAKCVTKWNYGIQEVRLVGEGKSGENIRHDFLPFISGFPLFQIQMLPLQFFFFIVYLLQFCWFPLCLLTL